MGALEWVLGEVQHKVLLLDPQPYLGVRGALPVLLRSSPQAWSWLGHLGCIEADFYPGPSVGVAGP